MATSWPIQWSGGDYDCYRTCALCSYSENIRPLHTSYCLPKAKEVVRRKRLYAETLLDEQKERELKWADDMEESIKRYQVHHRHATKATPDPRPLPAL